MGAQNTVRRELSPPLFGRFSHPGSSEFSDTPTELRHLYPAISGLGDSPSPRQVEGPSTLLTVLGIELDSLLLQARLPQEKFDHIHTLLVSWSLKLHCTRKELESLFGNLQHACKVVPSGRTFLHGMINLLSAFCRDDHPKRLNREFHLHLSWWLELFQSWSGYSFLLSPHWAPIPDLHVSSDAAGSVG